MQLLALIPGIGPVLAGLSTAWSVVSSPICRRLILATAIFWGGWHAKGWIDQASTARAMLAKTRIDLQAANASAEQAGIVVAEQYATDKNNQEIIRDLQDKLAQRPPAAATAGVCADTADDAIARKLRQLR
jgi:hypothetical protein